jgi:hypothetical protein
MPDELSKTCDRAQQHCHIVCLLRQTHSAMPHKRTGTLPPSSCTNGEDAFDARDCQISFFAAFYVTKDTVSVLS